MGAVPIALLLLSMAGPPDGPPSGWDTAGMTRERPALSYSEDGRPRLVMTCQGTATSLQVRGFMAAQSWPQPILTIKFGAAERSARPICR
jgi:hypothetical protein